MIGTGKDRKEFQSTEGQRRVQNDGRGTMAAGEQTSETGIAVPPGIPFSSAWIRVGASAFSCVKVTVPLWAASGPVRTATAVAIVIVESMESSELDTNNKTTTTIADHKTF